MTDLYLEDVLPANWEAFLYRPQNNDIDLEEYFEEIISEEVDKLH